MNKKRFPNARYKFHIQMRGENLPSKKFRYPFISTATAARYHVLHSKSEFSSASIIYYLHPLSFLGTDSLHKIRKKGEQGFYFDNKENMLVL